MKRANCVAGTGCVLLLLAIPGALVAAAEHKYGSRSLRSISFSYSYSSSYSFDQACPRPQDIQDPGIRESFDFVKWLGRYELLQYLDEGVENLSDLCGCTWADKAQVAVADPSRVDERFVTMCPGPQVQPGGEEYLAHLVSYATSAPGVFLTSWESEFPGASFLSTVVAVGRPEDTAGGEYTWSVEFQCLELQGVVQYVGAQFYSRYPRADPRGALAEEEMDVAAAKFGMYDFVASVTDTRAMTVVSHENCPAPPIPGPTTPSPATPNPTPNAPPVPTTFDVPWNANTNYAALYPGGLTINPGDSINFVFDTGHAVVIIPGATCDSIPDGFALSTQGPFKTTPRITSGLSVFYACSVGRHCENNGQLLRVNMN